MKFLTELKQEIEMSNDEMPLVTVNRKNVQLLIKAYETLKQEQDQSSDK